MNNAKAHAYKFHSPEECIECPLCKNYYAKNRCDYNEHAKKVHQMSAHDMKNLTILYLGPDPNDASMAKRPDGKVACLKCLDDQGAHVTFTRENNAKAHFKKFHGTGQQSKAKMESTDLDGAPPPPAPIASNQNTSFSDPHFMMGFGNDMY